MWLVLEAYFKWKKVMIFINIFQPPTHSYDRNYHGGKDLQLWTAPYWLFVASPAYGLHFIFGVSLLAPLHYESLPLYLAGRCWCILCMDAAAVCLTSQSSSWSNRINTVHIFTDFTSLSIKKTRRKKIKKVKNTMSRLISLKITDLIYSNTATA